MFNSDDDVKQDKKFNVYKIDLLSLTVVILLKVGKLKQILCQQLQTL